MTDTDLVTCKYVGGFVIEVPPEDRCCYCDKELEYMTREEFNNMFGDKK